MSQARTRGERPTGPRRDRTAALYVTFFLNGLVLPSWAPRIPQVKADLGLSESELGLALLGLAAGSVPAMAAAGWLVNRFGSQVVARVSLVAYCAALTLPGLATGLVELTASLAVLGAAVGSLDVAMNAHASAVERATGRGRMSRFHSLYSAGALVGALLGTLAAAAGVNSRAQFLATAMVTVAVATAVAAALEPAVAGRQAHDAPPRPLGRTRWLPPRRLVLLSCLGLAVVLIEGVMTDWSAVYLVEEQGADPGLGGAGFTTFILAMTAGRLGGDWAAGRWGRVRVVRTGALLAAAGTTTMLAVDSPVPAVAVCGLAGLGISASFPLVVSAAGRGHPQAPGTAVAWVSATGYFSYLAGPPLVGCLADLASLRIALLVLPALAVAAALLSPALAGPEDERNRRLPKGRRGVGDG